MPREKKLTTKQIKYCRERAAGKGYKEAYTAAGYSDKGNSKTLTDNAYNMENKSIHSTDILQKIKELQDRADRGGILQRRERLQLLSDIAADSRVKDMDRLRALDILARMNADYTDRVNVTGTGQIELSYADRLETIKQALKEE